MEEDSRKFNALLRAIYDSNNDDNPITEILQSISSLPASFEKIQSTLDEINEEVASIDLKPAQEEINTLPINALNQAQAVCLDLVVAANLIEQFEEQVFDGNFLEASRTMKQLSVDFSPVPESEVCKKLQAEITEKEAKLKDELDHQLQNLLVIKSNGVKLQHESNVKTCKGSSFVEADIKSLTAEILLEYASEDRSKYVQSLTSSVITVLKNVIQTKHFRSIQFGISKSAVLLGFATDRSLPFDVCVSINIVITILRFFKLYVLGDDASLYLEFFEMFWGRFQSEIVKESILEFHMPQTPAEAQIFANTCESIETILRPKMEKFELCPIEIDWGFLPSFLHDFEDIFLERFRNLTFQKVRTAIINTDYLEFEISVLEEEKSLFGKHSRIFAQGNRCKISNTIVSVIQIEYDLVAQLESLQNGDSSAMNAAFRRLIRSMLREVFYLWQSTTTKHYLKILQDHPKETFLFYNDCQFFRHHLSMLTFHLKYALHEEEVVLVDLIAMLKSFGEKHFAFQLEQQYDLIADELSDVDLNFVRNNVDEATEKVCTTLNWIHQLLNAIRGYVPDDLCYQIIGNLLDVICFHFVDAVFSRVTTNGGVIGIELAEELCGIFHIVGNYNKLKEFDMVYIQKHSKYFRRLERIGKLMEQDMSLAKLTDFVLAKGFEIFTFLELKSLVCALWDDNEKRRNFFNVCGVHSECFKKEKSPTSSKPDLPPDR